ncbi:MAG: acyltransferase, partial [Flavobacteriaceae bacterium]|nr:acyltransferase [Flavobacteriaceae bacterium]
MSKITKIKSQLRIDTRNRIFGLDVIRFVAISAVIFAHIGPFIKNHFWNLYEMLNRIGFLGVEIFFVLSGFLIGNLLYKRFVIEKPTKKSILHFWVRRWFRTLPNYYLVLLINIVVLAIVKYQLPNFEPARDIWKYFFFAHNLHSEQIVFFPESWSLSIEEYAYLIGPIMLYGAAFFFKNNRKIAFILAT